MLAPYAQPLGISTPATAAQLPFPVYLAGNEISAYVEARSYNLRDSGMNTASVLTFRIPDKTAAVAPWIAKKQRVLWMDSARDKPLFHGFIDNVRRHTTGPWIDLSVDCLQLSSVLDYSAPIIAVNTGLYAGGSDAAMIQALLAIYGTEPQLGNGGFIQTLSAGMPPTLPIDRTTLRSAIDKILAAANVSGAYAYVDDYGYLHTAAIGDVAAPYTISDAPDYATSVPAAISVEERGAQDVEAIYVIGGTPAGSGLVAGYSLGYGVAPTNGPARYAIVDAPHATDVSTRNSVARLHLQQRQNDVMARVTVTGYDGWAKGQLLTVTNAALGWSSKQLTVTAVDMLIRSGTGIRQYTLTAGTDPALFSTRHAALRAGLYGPITAGRIAGFIGGLSG